MPTPFRHPHYETARERQRRQAREELRANLDKWAPVAARVAAARVLEARA